MKIYRVYNCYFGYYDVNMFVKAKDVKSARRAAKKVLREDYRHFSTKQVPPKSSIVRLATDEYVEDMDLHRELAAIKRRKNGSVLIYDEGT